MSQAVVCLRRWGVSGCGVSQAVGCLRRLDVRLEILFAPFLVYLSCFELVFSLINSLYQLASIGLSTELLYSCFIQYIKKYLISNYS